MEERVVCAHCGSIYDLMKVTTVARYADCTVFTTPCCGREADDRRWKPRPDFERLQDPVAYFGQDYEVRYTTDPSGRIIEIRGRR